MSVLTQLEPGQAGPRINRQADAYQHCMVGIRKFWSADIYKQVLKEIRASHTESEIDAATPDELERDSLKHTTYQYFAWLEHQLQQYKYLGRYGVVTEIAKQAPQLAELLDSAASRMPERLHLNPDIVLPAYYKRADFHQHPGGIWHAAGLLGQLRATTRRRRSFRPPPPTTGSRPSSCASPTVPLGGPKQMVPGSSWRTRACTGSTRVAS